MSADATSDLRMTVSWFGTASPDGPAFGDQERISWGAFTSFFECRREGGKDGPNFIPSRFKLEGRQVRRLAANVLARAAIALDIEASKKTGEVPPALDEAMNRASGLGIEALGYTSHNHRLGDTRYRLVVPLSGEIAPELPAPEVLAERLGLLGTLVMSKTTPASLFYLPSCPYGTSDLHETLVIPACQSMPRGWWKLLACSWRPAKADRIAAEAQAEAAARREAKIAAGFDPDDSLIEKLRSRFDLDDVLRSHGYNKSGSKYRHPNSASGSYGADIKTLGGIERVFSHNATDPLHGSNLPVWCGGVTAIDAFDVTVILDFGGDRTRALRELAERFNLTKATERRALARLLFRLIKRRATQEEIEAAAFAEGVHLGLSRNEICRLAIWVASQSSACREAG